MRSTSSSWSSLKLTFATSTNVSSSFYSSSSLNFVLIFMAHVIAHFKQLIPFTVRINFTPSMVFAHKPFKNTISTWYGFILKRFKQNVYILSQITLGLKAHGMVIHNKILSYIIENLITNYESVKHILPSGLCSTCRQKDVCKIEWPIYKEWIETLSRIPIDTVSSLDCQCFICVCDGSCGKSSCIGLHATVCTCEEVNKIPTMELQFI